MDATLTVRAITLGRTKEYDVKNYADRGECYSTRPYAEMDNSLRDQHNYSQHTKAEFNCFYNVIDIHSNISKF